MCLSCLEPRHSSPDLSLRESVCTDRIDKWRGEEREGIVVENGAGSGTIFVHRNSRDEATEGQLDLNQNVWRDSYIVGSKSRAKTTSGLIWAGLDRGAKESGSFAATRPPNTKSTSIPPVCGCGADAVPPEVFVVSIIFCDLHLSSSRLRFPTHA